jgi:transcription elongation factor Elf1
MRREQETALKAVRIEVLDREIICPYCRKVMVFALRSNLYPKGSTMRCTECKGMFKKFLREMRRE